MAEKKIDYSKYNFPEYAKSLHNAFEEQRQEKIAQEEAIHKREIENQNAVDAIRKDRNEQIDAINTQLYNAISELHKRPARPSNALSINGQSGTGRSLFAEDAIFLEREAARADTIRTALDACYKQYDEVTK